MKESTSDNKKSANKLTPIFLGITLVSLILIFFFWYATQNSEGKEMNPELRKDVENMKHEIDNNGYSKYRIRR